MGRGDVFVNPRARVGGTLLAETEMPRMMIVTPAFVPRVKIPLDLRIITNRLYITRPPEMVCYELPTLDRLTTDRLRRTRQRTFTGESLDPAFERFTRETAAMVDPFSEYFTYRRQHSKKRDGETVYVRDRIAGLPNFPTEVAERLSDDRWGLKVWTDLIEHNLHLTLIDWYFVYQSPIRPLIFIPPVNVVDGNHALKVAMTLNDAAANAFPPGEEPTVPAMYLPLHSSVFQSPAFMDTLFKALASFATDQRILVLKLLWFRNVRESSAQIEQLKRFLSRLDGLKRQVHDSALIFALEAQEEGLAYLGNGMDAYGEPIDGFPYFPQARKSVPPEVKAQRAIDLDLEDDDGWWLRPKLRDRVPSAYADIAASCDCPAHHGELVADPMDLAIRRRAHHYNIRTMEVDLLRDAVESGDADFVRRIISDSSRKNLVDLLQ